MTAAGVLPENWQEFCKIGIVPEAYPTGAGGGEEIAFAGMTEDITAMDWGERDIEGMPLVNGGRVIKTSPMGDESMTLKVYDVDALLDTANVANGVVQLMHPQSTEDATVPVLVDNSIYRRRFRIILLWATTLPATAGAIPGDSIPAYRIQIVNAYMTSFKPDYGDKLKSAEITFKWAPFNKAATANKREEYTDGSDYLPAVSASCTVL